METSGVSLEQLEASRRDALEGTAARLGDLVAEVAARLQPFPAFWGMVSLQAVELEPPLRAASDRGCVVVTAEGRICQLDLAAIPGMPGGAVVDQVEQLQDMDLSPEEYIVYASVAIRQLLAELERRQR